MKTFHTRLLSLVLALALSFSLCLPAFADEEVVNINDIPASLLIMDDNGKPVKIYGNQHIDWDAIEIPEEDRLNPQQPEAFQPVDFDDVPATHPAYNAIKTILLYDGLDNTGGNFRPDDSILKFEFLSMICRVFYGTKNECGITTRSNMTYETVRQIAQVHKIADVSAYVFKPEQMATAKTNAIGMATVAQNVLNDLGKDINVDTVLPAGYDKTNTKASTVTRATAAIIIANMINAIQPEQPKRVADFIYSETPAIPIALKPTYHVKNAYQGIEDCTSWTVLYNNRNETGKLSNGKDITPENIDELLDLVQMAFPTGTRWTEAASLAKLRETETDVENNNYANPSGIVNSVILSKYNISTNTACGGFAAMVSDILFGNNANPAHQVTTADQVHAGDIVFLINSGKIYHVQIITYVDTEDMSYGTADGNSGTCVDWAFRTIDNSVGTKYIQTQMNSGQTLFFTRWP